MSYITISDIFLPLSGIPMMGTAVETLGRISLTISLKTTRANKTVTPETTKCLKGFFKYLLIGVVSAFVTSKIRSIAT